MPEYVPKPYFPAHIERRLYTQQSAQVLVPQYLPGCNIIRLIPALMVCNDTYISVFFQRRYFPGSTAAVCQRLFTDHDRDTVFRSQDAVIKMAVRVGGYTEEGHPVIAKHLGGIGVNRDLPAFSKKTAPFPVNVGARHKEAVRVCRYRAGMGTGLFTEAIIFQKACDTPEAYNGGFDWFHNIMAY
jgi:hypothetical protein